MKKLSEETAKLISKLKDAVEEEGGECIISIGKGKYLSQAIYGETNNIIALLCCGVDQVANKTGMSAASILMKMLDVVLNVEGDKE